MEKKKIIICAVIFAGGLLGFLLANNNTKVADTQITSSEPQETSVQKEDINTENNVISEPEKQSSESVKQISVNKDVTLQTGKVNTSLYSDFLDDAIPISAISEISILPENIQNIVINAAKASNGIYMLKRHGNKVLMIADNQANLRHGVEFTEILIPSGHRTTTTFGYNDRMKDSDNDIWSFDAVGDIQRPLKHTKYNTEGDLEFTEIWNYDDSNPVKYEMKDATGKIISMRKETLDDGTHLRVEHLLYDKDGNTKINVSVAYDGNNVQRFTYYNAEKPQESGSVYGEYKDGNKIKEIVYSSDLKVKNVYEPVYTNGNRTEIKVLDSKNNEVGKLVSE